MAESYTTKNITTVEEVNTLETTDKIFVNDSDSLKQISLSNLMDSSGALKKNQGAGNSGKTLIVGEDGNVVLGEKPVKVDSTLTQSGQAADAKTTGDKLSSLSDDINQINSVAISAVSPIFEQGGLSPSDGSEVENNTRIRSNIVRVIKGSSIYLINKQYKFGVWQYDEDGVYLKYRGLEQNDFIADSNMYIRILISNGNDSMEVDVSEANAVKTMLFSANFDYFNKLLNGVESINMPNWKSGYVGNNQNVGEFVPLKRTATGQWFYQVLRVKKGDKFNVSGYSGNAPKLWCFTDNKFYKLSGYSESGYTKNNIIEAPDNGYLVVNSEVSYNHSLKKICENVDDNMDAKEEFASYVNGYEKYNKIIPPYIPEVTPIMSVPFNKTSAMNMNEIISGYDGLAQSYPGYVTKKLMGYDTSGEYPVYRYDFTPDVPNIDGTTRVTAHSYTSDDYPVIIMDACIHGAERPCAKALLNLMALISEAKDNSILGWLRNNIHFVIVPIVNVWGYANDSRNNVNDVDLNRNFPVYWDKGEDTTEGDRYRGTSPLSEKESQYMDSIFSEFEGNAVCYYNWHTHGLFTGYDVMTAFNTSFLENFDVMQNIGFSVIKSITASGWTNHNLPKNSGYIGMVQITEEKGLVSHTATLHNIPSACPEVMYRYYDGGTSEVYNNDVDCMNVEYMLYAVANACKAYLYQ